MLNYIISFYLFATPFNFFHKFGGVGDKQRQVEGNVLVKVKYEQGSINILNFKSLEVINSVKIVNAQVIASEFK